MERITVGVLTISDRCASNQATDESGANLIQMIKKGLVSGAVVVETGLLPDEKVSIQRKLMEWCDDKKIHLVLTTGGTGVGPRDVTPEATLPLLDKILTGFSQLMFKQSSEITPLAALSRAVSGVRGGSLIVNLPGSKKASMECLLAIAEVIPHAVDSIRDVQEKVRAVHSSLQEKRSKVVMSSVSERPRKSPYVCVELPTAQQIVLERVSPLRRTINMNSANALGYVLAENVIARDDLPPSDVSLKDGYAVLSSDGTTNRKVVGSVAAGIVPTSDLNLISGCCVRINTGAAVPEGADAVVQVEDTKLECVGSDGEEGYISVLKSPRVGEDIRRKGSDFKTGDLLLEPGTYLGSSALGLLAAAGVSRVDVFVKPIVAIFSTGDELVEHDAIPQPGRVRDTNRISLINLLKEQNFQPLDFGVVKDNVDALFDALNKGFQTADIVVTTGGMSMGEKDYLKEVLLEDFNAEICFGRVVVKPGKPTAFAVVGGFEGKPKLWFGLPGNPASAIVTANLFLLPALRSISGWKKCFPPRLQAVVESDVKGEDRPHYCRATLTYDEENNRFVARPTGNQSSSRVGSCATANCLLEIPVGTDIAKGSSVKALLIGRLE